MTATGRAWRSSRYVPPRGGGTRRRGGRAVSERLPERRRGHRERFSFHPRLDAAERKPGVYPYNRRSSRQRRHRSLIGEGEIIMALKTTRAVAAEEKNRASEDIQSDGAEDPQKLMVNGQERVLEGVDPDMPLL